ncbi:MAG TPA: hypothetical protein VLS28_10825 [Candidatus Sulfomarinibacteraceae bacterium]|nr:hypothetical protein [Candidatus Sulfomarinibacteraceae bacterium]
MGTILVSASAAPLCPVCHSPAAAWEIDSPVRALDRVTLDPSGLTLLGLVAPPEGLEPLGHPEIHCAACRAAATESTLRDAVLAAATAASRGEAPRFDA